MNNRRPIFPVGPPPLIIPPPKNAKPNNQKIGESSKKIAELSNQIIKKPLNNFLYIFN